MKLEEQVCDLELAKQLKELDAKQDSLYSWFETKTYGLIIENSNASFDLDHYISVRRCASAFTASELISLLPNRITLKTGEPFNSFTIIIRKSFVIDKDDEHLIPIPIYIINYECDTAESGGINAWQRITLFNHNCWDKNFCNALAKTLIYLIENKLL